MKRKFWVVLLAIVAMLCMAFGLAACKDKGFGKKDPDDTGNNPPAVDPSGGEQGGNQGEPGGEQKPDDGEQEPGEEKHVHIMVEHQQEDATCTVEGKRAYWHCSGCNKDYLDQDGNEEAGDLTIPAVGHVLQKVEKKEPTCLEDGNVEYYHCSVCEKDYPENDKFSKDELNSTVLPATGHNFQEHERKEATCFENGNIAYYHCTNCNKDFDSSYEPVENVTIPATHFYFSEKENPEGYTVLGPVVTCKCAELEIPEEYEGHKVIGIDDYAFYGCDWVTSITIPNSVTSIGARAFYECSGLTSINIPDRVTSIGSEAFMDCSGLTSINIPDSVTAIGYAAFHGCSGLTSITIPDSVTAIGYAAFHGCSGLTSVTIPDSVTAIGEGAFYQCSGLTSVTIGNGVTSIGQAAFIDCSRLTSVNLIYGQ